jgi:two-component system cell cycle sensor histidine kinase/response regulator CckA
MTRPHAETHTVLVVDDAQELREVARRLLQRQGYTVLVAGSADEALRLFEENPLTDVLLTDVVLPGASGPELARQLTEQQPALKVIYMSGYTDEDIDKHSLLSGQVALLRKPFTAETLGRIIREVLD